MKTYYNENAKYPAKWLRNLAEAGQISKGEIDDRSITDISPDDLDGYTRAHFFAGIGGWEYALKLAKWPRNRSVWTGSCPCQSFSDAGLKRGFDDPRHLFPIWLPLIRAHRPAVIFGEQTQSQLALEWLDLVQTDLEGEGYAVWTASLGAHSVNAPHRRQRIWFAAIDLANTDGIGIQGGKQPTARATAETQGNQLPRPGKSHTDKPWDEVEWIECKDGTLRCFQPGAYPLSISTPGRVGQIQGYGNAIVPQIAAVFIKSVKEALYPQERINGHTRARQDEPAHNKRAWKTPTAKDATGATDDILDKIEEDKKFGLNDQVTLLPDYPGKRPPGLEQGSEKGILNPEFARWLMGYPKEWGELSPTTRRST